MIKFISYSVTAMLFFVVLGTINITTSWAQDATFCWRDTDARGVGKVPKICSPGQKRIGLLCYDQCPKGMKKFGFDCHSVCPDGMRNDGLFCRKTGYDRGVGRIKRACENKFGQGNCQKQAALWYQKCRPGFKGVATMCRPEKKPDCRKLGLKPSGIAPLSCAKVIKIGKPRTGICGPGQDKNSGLCYRRCKPGFRGVGPVCWGATPPGWVNCGAAAAKTKKDCGTTIVNMFAGVGEAVLSLATMGGYGAVDKATDAVELAVDAGKAAKKGKKAKFWSRQLTKMQGKLKKAKRAIRKQTKEIDQIDRKIGKLAKKKVRNEYRKLKKLVARKTEIKKRLKLANERLDQINRIIEKSKIDESSGRATEASREARGIEITNKVLDTLSYLDPTGLIGAANSFVFPKCSQLFFKSEIRKNRTFAVNVMK
jgi:hypothetical protein